MRSFPFLFFPLFYISYELAYIATLEKIIIVSRNDFLDVLALFFKLMSGVVHFSLMNFMFIWYALE